jgi:putative colanic acid biosynthesis glycosyltransferase
MRISVITIAKQNIQGLIRTLDSLAEQKKYGAIFEVIVIDGGSDDGTSYSVKTAYKELVDILISEEDSGVYDAMNKGARLARGDALFFLNAGDVIVGNVLSHLMQMSAPAFILVKRINYFGFLSKINIVSEKYRMSNCHQGILFENKGMEYDTSYKISSDYDYFLKHGYSLNIPLVRTEGFIFVEPGGINAREYKIRDRELLKIRIKYFGNVLGILYHVPIVIKQILRKLIPNNFVLNLKKLFIK